MVSIKWISHKSIQLRFKLTDDIITKNQLIASAQIVDFIGTESTPVWDMRYGTTPIPAASLIYVSNLPAEILYFSVDIQRRINLIISQYILKHTTHTTCPVSSITGIHRHTHTRVR